ncbi:transposase [Streptomyces sp. NPDC059991]|uniref:transposase n=1 Tax=Streptomyces sp. NPDC059991 TaxID=3347028 RepID=UPI0036A2F3E0
MRAWLEEKYPAIAARAKREKAEPVWADQCGLRSDTAPPGRSWAPAGRTPIVRVNGRRFKVNIMSAVASRGALWFTVFPEKFTADVLSAFGGGYGGGHDRGYGGGHGGVTVVSSCATQSTSPALVLGLPVGTQQITQICTPSTVTH